MGSALRFSGRILQCHYGMKTFCKLPLSKKKFYKPIRIFMTVDKEKLISSTYRGCQEGYRKPGVSDGGREERHNQTGELD